jgi:hypothetical protein
LASLSAAWSAVALLTGGLSVNLGPLHLSSRNPRNPALAALLLLALAWALSVRGIRRQQLRTDWLWLGSSLRALAGKATSCWIRGSELIERRIPPSVAPACALGLACGVVVLALRESQFVAAASDAWGYVSQAHMWATWTLRVPEPLMRELAGFVPRDALAPLAYRPTADAAAIVPITSPGLPMLMALFEAAAGPDAVFAVVPLLAAVSVWASFLIGRELAGRWAGVIAAGLLATSPAFLFQLTSAPMSDIPASALWGLSLAFAMTGRGLRSGLAGGLAILIRANLAPVAIVPALIVWLRAARSGARQLLLFAAGVIPAALTIAVLYDYWYGSPLNSGYGTLQQLYSTGNLPPNLSRYSQWLLESQTPVVILALFAPALARDRRTAAALLAFVAAVTLAYLFYIPFDAWWFLRFLLPGFPALMALVAAGLVAVAGRLPRSVRVVVTAAVLAIVVDHTITYAAARATFDSEGEQKYAITGRYIASHLPRDAVIFSDIYSGSIRYYASRTTIRFRLVPPDHLEGAVAELQRRGYRPYLVVEDWEEDAFRDQFAGRRILEMLAAGPVVELPLGHVRIYALTR